MKAKLAALACAMLLTACGGTKIDSPGTEIVLQSDSSGRPVLEYAQVARPLEALITNDNPYSAVRVLPTAPTSAYDQSQVTDYWMGATSEALRRCGYAGDAVALRGKALDSSAFDTGSNKLKGDKMVSCGQAKRLSDAIMAQFAKTSG
jgi:hypothetical protein